MVLNGVLILFVLTLISLIFKQTVQNLIRHRVPQCLIWVCTVCQCTSPGFTDNPLYTALWRHSDKNSAAINIRYLHFIQTRGLISLVNADHGDNSLKEILVFVYYGSIVNNRPSNLPITQRRLIVLWFNDTSTLVGHCVTSPRKREKRNRRDSRGDKREGQGRKRNRNECEETEEIKTFPLYPYLLQG